MAALRAIAKEKTSQHRQRFVGRELEAITLHSPAELEIADGSAALTENFLPVALEGRVPANRLVRIRVKGVSAEGTLLGVLSDSA